MVARDSESRYQNGAQGGQITLPFVLLISGIILEIAIAGSFVTYFLSTSGYGDRLAERASVAAHSGIRDALIRITENKEFTSASCAAPSTYAVPVGSDNAAVSVCRAIDLPTHTYLYTIASVGTAVSREKKFVATLIVDQTTGRVSLESIIEQTVQ